MVQTGLSQLRYPYECYGRCGPLLSELYCLNKYQIMILRVINVARQQQKEFAVRIRDTDMRSVIVLLAIFSCQVLDSVEGVGHFSPSASC
jgi:hypothetical protein